MSIKSLLVASADSPVFYELKAVLVGLTQRVRRLVDVNLTIPEEAKPNSCGDKSHFGGMQPFGEGRYDAWGYEQ